MQDEKVLVGKNIQLCYSNSQNIAFLWIKKLVRKLKKRALDGKAKRDIWHSFPASFKKELKKVENKWRQKFFQKKKAGF